jgi:hypothetical protein
LVRNTFTRAYLKKYKCQECENPCKERCHGIGEERPLLIKRALEKVYPDITKTFVEKVDSVISLKEKEILPNK